MDHNNNNNFRVPWLLYRIQRSLVHPCCQVHMCCKHKTLSSGLECRDRSHTTASPRDSPVLPTEGIYLSLSLSLLGTAASQLLATLQTLSLAIASSAGLENVHGISNTQYRSCIARTGKCPSIIIQTTLHQFDIFAKIMLHLCEHVRNILSVHRLHKSNPQLAMQLYYVKKAFKWLILH